MEINYFISAKATATVQNINVSLSAEYQKEQAPEVISVVANGYLDDGKKFMNATLNTILSPRISIRLTDQMLTWVLFRKLFR